MMVFWTAFTIGLLGSFHCAGMCGPIAFALPVGNRSNTGKITAALLYNLGRIITYSAFGLLFGLLGKGFKMAGWQQSISLIIGVLFILVAVVPAAVSNKLNPTGYIGRLTAKLKHHLGKLFRLKSKGAFIGIGLLNGLLPCGLVYAAIGGAITMGSALEGSLFMALFGLGTLPLMIGIILAANQISVKIRSKIRKLVPVFILLMGLLFILRGLNLGIPYLSPEINTENPIENSSCH